MVIEHELNPEGVSLEELEPEKFDLEFFRTPLHAAVEDQNYEEINSILKNKKVDPYIQNEQGYTAMALSAHRGDIEALKLFLDAGVDINHLSNDPQRTTILMDASLNGQEDTVKFLLERGADIFIKSSNGKTVFELIEEADGNFKNANVENYNVIHKVATKLLSLLNEYKMKSIVNKAEYKGITTNSSTNSAIPQNKTNTSKSME